MVRHYTALLIGTILCMCFGGCARHLNRSLDTIPAYDLRVTDEPSSRLFRLQLKSRSDTAFCFASEAWPNALGQVAAGSQLIELHWKDGQAFAKGGFDEHCSRGCQVVVPAGGTLVGEIRYGVFGDAEWVLSLPNRSLEVRVTPFECNEVDHRK